MKTCPECAEEVQDAARVCRYCGSRFDAQVAAPADSAPDLAPLPATGEPGQRYGGPAAAGVIGGGLLLGSLFLPWYDVYVVGAKHEAITDMTGWEALEFGDLFILGVAVLALVVGLRMAMRTRAWRGRLRAARWGLLAGMGAAAFALFRWIFLPGSVDDRVGTIAFSGGRSVGPAVALVGALIAAQVGGPAGDGENPDFVQSYIEKHGHPPVVS